MQNFELYNPVNYVFGKGQIEKLKRKGKEIKTKYYDEQLRFWKHFI